MIPLRERQGQLARAMVIDALIARLEAGDEDCTVEEVARDAGVSRRTLYRYFPSRQDLYSAAADGVYARMGQVGSEVADAGDIANSFIAGSRVTEEHPRLSRALLHAPAGRGIRMTIRRRRTASIEKAVAELGSSRPPAEVRGRAAVVALLCNAQAFIALQDESGLTPDESRAAILGAIELLLDDVRRRPGRSRTTNSAGMER